LEYVAEGFAARTYEPDGSLTPRTVPGAVITSADAVLSQAISLVEKHVVATRVGGQIDMVIQTLCLHGDTPGADEHARAIRLGLERAGISVHV